MIEILLITALVLALFYGTQQFIFDKLYRLPPGPMPLPFFGNTLSMRKEKKRWVYFDKISKQFGPVSVVYIGQHRLVLLNGKEAINEGIVVQNKIFSDRPSTILPGAFAVVPIGVMFADGKSWQERRRFCLRALRDFGMGKIGIVDNIHSEASYFLETLEKLTDEPFDPKHLLTNTISNVICSLVFGKRFCYDDPVFVELGRQIHYVTANTFSRRIEFFILPFLRFFFKPEEVGVWENLYDCVMNMLKESVADHRQDFNESNLRDFPDLFIQSELKKSSLDFTTFANVMADLFIAGTDTTANALNWTLIYLSKYPCIQQRCQDAIDEAIGTDRMPMPSDRPNLVYVDALMCEVLRHACIAPVGLFHCNLNTTSTINGFDIPHGSMVCYNIWALHNDRSYWKNPENFDPDRWIDEDGELLLHSSHFMPFGAGPRICLGESLARFEYFLFLVAVVQRFSFQLAPGQDHLPLLEDGIPGVTYAPRPYKIIAKKR